MPETPENPPARRTEPNGVAPGHHGTIDKPQEAGTTSSTSKLDGGQIITGNPIDTRTATAAMAPSGHTRLHEVAVDGLPDSAAKPPDMVPNRYTHNVRHPSSDPAGSAVNDRAHTSEGNDAEILRQIQEALSPAFEHPTSDAAAAARNLRSNASDQVDASILRQIEAAVAPDIASSESRGRARFQRSPADLGNEAALMRAIEDAVAPDFGPGTVAENRVGAIAMRRIEEALAPDSEPSPRADNRLDEIVRRRIAEALAPDRESSPRADNQVDGSGMRRSQDVVALGFPTDRTESPNKFDSGVFKPAEFSYASPELAVNRQILAALGPQTDWHGLSGGMPELKGMPNPIDKLTESEKSRFGEGFSYRAARGIAIAQGLALGLSVTKALAPELPKRPVTTLVTDLTARKSPSVSLYFDRE